MVPKSIGDKLIFGNKLGEFGKTSGSGSIFQRRFTEEIRFARDTRGDAESIDGDVEFCMGC